MAGVDRLHHNGRTTSILEQLLHSDGPTAWNMPLTFGRIHDPEDDHFHHGRKFSVVAKVKEKARKWQQRLVRKKHVDDDNNTPSWGVALEDYEEEDLEHLGASTYESEHASKSCNKIVGQHPGADEVISENYISGNSVNRCSDNEQPEKYSIVMNNTTGSKIHPDDKENPYMPKMTTNKAFQAESFGNHQTEEAPTTIETLRAQRNADQLQEKFPCAEMIVETGFKEICSVEDEEEGPSTEKTTAEYVVDEREEKHASSMKMTETDNTKRNYTEEQDSPPAPRKTIKAAMSEKLAPAYATVSEATYKITSKIQGLSPFQGTGEEGKWDRGVPFTEYIRSKLKPGENESAFSQIISELFRPRKTPSEKGILEKVKEALTLLLQVEEPSLPSSMKSRDSACQFPVSTNACEVGEEHQGRILQAK